MKRAYVLLGICWLGICLIASGCSNGEEDRRADCAKISSALSETADPSAEQVLDALREVRPGLTDDDLAEQVDTVIASGGKTRMSDEETLRFAEAAERIREACKISG